jgi:hypothetical protein
MWNVSFVSIVRSEACFPMILILFFNCHTGGTKSLLSTMTPEKSIARTLLCRMGGVMFWEKIVADFAEEGAV